jgi:Kef-type K+ transport system membrane component KefB
LLLGNTVGLIFGYRIIPAIVIGSLIASHTLLASPIVAQYGVNRLEPVIVTVGATVLSDTFSLVVFAICVSTYEKGFSLSGFAAQVIEIAMFVPFILFGLSRVGAYVLSKVEAEENAYFVLTFCYWAEGQMHADARFCDRRVDPKRQQRAQRLACGRVHRR